MLCTMAVGIDDDIGEGFSDGEECRGHQAIIAGFREQGECRATMGAMHERRDDDSDANREGRGPTSEPQASPAPATVPAPKSHYQLPTRKNTSLRNMIWALGLTMLIVVAVGIGFFGVGSDQSREPLPNTEVDLAQTAERAQESAPYPVVVPAAGEEWAVRSVRFTDAPDRWEVRYSSPQRHLVTMVQAPEISAPMLSASFPGAVEGEEQEIAGVPCRVLSGGTDDEPHAGLSCAGDGWGLLIHGATELEELQELAEAAITSID